MAVSSGPNLIEDGLVLSLDAGDINSVMGATVEVLVVAGGGGGGMDMGGGGGGGGVIYNPSYAVTQGTAITVTVGNGGYGAPAAGTYRGDGVGPQPNSHQYTVSATQGGNSVFGSLTAIGGGFGASSYYGYLPNSGIGGTGGSGGGCSGYTHGGERYVDGTNGSTANNTAGQGFPGGNSGNPTTGADDHYSGGGGGAGGRGTSGPGHVGPNGVKPNGGPGILYPTMSSYYFAGGGGGSAYSASSGGDGGIGGGGGGAVGVTVGGAGLNNGSAGGGGSPNSQTNTPGGDAGANTGGGGGGGSHYNSNNRGGNGGSGIVIVRYSGPQKATGGTVSTVAGYTIHTFTSSGTFTPNSIWYDNSGAINNFAIVNSPALSANEFILNGTTQYFSISAASGFFISSTNNFYADVGYAWTISVWFKFPVSPTSLRDATINGGNCSYSLVGNSGGIGGAETIALFVSGISGTSAGFHPYYCVVGVRGSKTQLSVGSVNTNTWNNVVITWNGSAGRGYFNGIDRGALNIGANGMQVSGYTVGATAGGFSSHLFEGSISQTFVYSRAISDAEVLQNYNSTKSRFGL